MTRGQNYATKARRHKRDKSQRIMKTAFCISAERSSCNTLTISKLNTYYQYPGFWTRALLVANSVGGIGKMQR